MIDVAATVLEAAGIPEPTFVHGTQQMPLHGASLIASMHDGNAPEFRQTQYFEMMCNRGIYHQGWTACTKHSISLPYSRSGRDMTSRLRSRLPSKVGIFRLIRLICR